MGNFMFNVKLIILLHTVNTLQDFESVISMPQGNFFELQFRTVECKLENKNELYKMSKY